MNNKDFITKLSAALDLPMTDTQHVADTIINAMGRQFEDGETVQIPAFAVFEVKKHKERVMVNPTTGKRMLIPPKLVLGFKPSSAVRGHFKKGGED